jgi:hypothetical protein
MLSDSRREDDWMVASITGIQSLLNFLLNEVYFVIVVPKYLNCTTFSKHLLAILMSWFFPAIWWQDTNIYSVFSVLYVFSIVSKICAILNSIFIYYNVYIFCHILRTERSWFKSSGFLLVFGKCPVRISVWTLTTLIKDFTVFFNRWTNTTGVVFKIIPRPLPHTSSIHHSIVILKFGAVCSELLTVPLDKPEINEHPLCTSEST